MRAQIIRSLSAATQVEVLSDQMDARGQHACQWWGARVRNSEGLTPLQCAVGRCKSHLEQLEDKRQREIRSLAASQSFPEQKGHCSLSGACVWLYKPLRLLSSDYYFSLFCGSFSAVSKPNFASKYLFCSIFQDLHNEHAFAPPTAQNLQTFAQFCKFLMTFPDFLKILLKFDEIVLFFGENFTEFRRNSRESQLIHGNSDFFQKIRKIVLEF